MTTETFYSAKIHNTASEPRRVKCYYSAPERQIVEDIQVIEPKQQAVFAPRIYKIKEEPAQRYTLEKVELYPVESTEEIIEPVVFEPAREYRVEKPTEAVTLHITETDGAYRFDPAVDTECCRERVIISE